MADDSAIVRRVTEEVFVAGNIDLIDELVSDEFVDHDPPPEVPGTKEGFRILAEMVTSAFSDFAIEFDEYHETTGGLVVENWAMTGKHTGEAFGMPPSGEVVRVRGVELFRCEDGKIAEHWGAVDMSDLAMKAMGQT